MKENQNIEWKESWRDEFLKWICGFANADGGVLVIGRNDQGQPVGVTNANKLLEDPPNKIRDVLGIMAAVNLVKKSGKDLIEIRVEPYLTPISYKGEYHIRSGSTKQELKGAALERFLLKKRGRRWDDTPEPTAARRRCHVRTILLASKRLRNESPNARGGVIWHTQGSGKSILMVLIAKWLLKYGSDARILVITDRDELDKQIEGVMRNAGIVENSPSPRITSRAEFVQKLAATKFDEALKTLTRSEPLNTATFGKPTPGDLAFMAMCHQRLNHTDEAQKFLDRLGQVMLDAQFNDDSECRVILREAEALIALSPKQD